LPERRDFEQRYVLSLGLFQEALAAMKSVSYLRSRIETFQKCRNNGEIVKGAKAVE
jgi:hypothetical protein